MYPTPSVAVHAITCNRMMVNLCDHSLCGLDCCRLDMCRLDVCRFDACSFKIATDALLLSVAQNAKLKFSNTS